MNVEFTVQVWKDRATDQYIAHAMPVNVTSCGPTVAKATAAVTEAVDVFLQTASEDGNLEQILQACGYELVGGVWKAPEVVERADHSITVST